MIKTLVVPDTYKYVIDRVIYEINIRAKNLAFMLDKNLDNPDFLNTDLCRRLEDELVDAYLNRWIVLSSICDTLEADENANLSMDFITRKYSLTWVEGKI